MVTLAEPLQAGKDIAVKNHSIKAGIFKADFFLSSRAAAVALALAACSTAALGEGTEAQRQACTGDVFRLCSSDIPNVDKIVACLKTNRSKLSPACGAVFNTATASATRSLASSDVDWCAFTPGNTDQVHQDWKNWCGPAAH
jgi:hypothetical protein